MAGKLNIQRNVYRKILHAYLVVNKLTCTSALIYYGHICIQCQWGQLAAAHRKSTETHRNSAQRTETHQKRLQASQNAYKHNRHMILG